MIVGSIILGSPDWLAVAVGASVLAVAAMVWGYSRVKVRRPVWVACALLKGVALAAMAVCLLEPLLMGQRAVPGANIFLIVADNSQSLRINDGDSDETRGDVMRETLDFNNEWRTRLGQDFDVRNTSFDTQLNAVDDFDRLEFDGASSSLNATLDSIRRRYRNLPLAGLLLFTDGNATDVGDVDWSGLPPIYPVLPKADSSIRDLGISRVMLNQSNFEQAPVALQAELSAKGLKGETIIATVLNERGTEVARQQQQSTSNDETLNFRFQLQPEMPGVSFYRVVATVEDDDDAEQTLANNARLVVVERGQGPYRVLYVSGRPNWEFKFLRRALAEDTEIDLVGLIRIARKAPRFDFRDQAAKDQSELFKGFEADDTAERCDQPVLLRLGTRDDVELRAGFPQTSKELFGYHAVILDDVEAGFFNQDQLSLIRDFVRRRGGGFLMLGGPGAYADGSYAKTPIGELLPVYIDSPKRVASQQDYRLVLTRGGWLQPWVRTRKTEAEERRRLSAMTPFQSIEPVGEIKPGAAVLSEVRDAVGTTRPALVVQQYGKGRSMALLIGDLWRWGLKRADVAEDDFDRSWRQTVRYLVGDVPRRVEITLTSDTAEQSAAVSVEVRSLDDGYLPLDNAAVSVNVTRPDRETITLSAQPDDQEAGLYIAKFVPQQSGAYRVLANVATVDGKPVGQNEAGWAYQPEADEFARMMPNVHLMEMIATKTGGHIIDADNLESFVEELPTRKAPITETWVRPLWHYPLFGLLIVVCLVGEWGLRRLNGLA